MRSSVWFALSIAALLSLIAGVLLGILVSKDSESNPSIISDVILKKSDQPSSSNFNTETLEQVDGIVANKKLIGGDISFLSDGNGGLISIPNPSSYIVFLKIYGETIRVKVSKKIYDSVSVNDFVVVEFKNGHVHSFVKK